MENYTIIDQNTGSHYDTNDERFYNSSWEMTKDKKEYLEILIKSDPEKFVNCKIVDTRRSI